ncbi:MAG: hypothetical protein KJZ86_19370, partial [Caldilineaceae bacterium]|nr:hypothetical protein [Caldilineaceae bacterium]
VGAVFNRTSARKPEADGVPTNRAAASRTYAFPLPHPKHLHHLIPQMIDHLHRNPPEGRHL